MIEALLFAAKTLAFITGSIAVLGGGCLMWMLVAEILCGSDDLLPKEVDTCPGRQYTVCTLNE